MKYYCKIKDNEIVQGPILLPKYDSNDNIVGLKNATEDVLINLGWYEVISPIIPDYNNIYQEISYGPYYISGTIVTRDISVINITDIDIVRKNKYDQIEKQHDAKIDTGYMTSIGLLMQIADIDILKQHETIKLIDEGKKKDKALISDKNEDIVELDIKNAKQLFIECGEKRVKMAEKKYNAHRLLNTAMTIEDILAIDIDFDID